MEQWLSVLALSTRWDMTAIRAEAIKNVRAALDREGLPPHKVLNLGQTHRVDEWVIIAIIFLIKRKEPMGPDDAKIIGIENALKIASLRECCVQERRLEGSCFRLVAERPHMAGGVTDTKRIEQVFGVGSSGN